ncbi:MAG: Ni,Fe-hydrogenase cytochrome b subunit [Sphingobacteriales bacterium]|nr:Ni,Fe-hydrogenase cytochrome b subunit [Sphingobacteriales bacterium]
MATIEPVRQDIEYSNSIKKNSASLRVWHWASALIITGSLLTVLINSTLLDPGSNTGFIKSLLQHEGAIISLKQAGSVALGLEDRVWDIHIYLGYFLTGLLLFRVFLELFQHSSQKFFRKLKKAQTEYSNTGGERKIALHELTVKILYLTFYLLLIIMVITGLSLAFKNEFGIPKSIADSVKEVHGFCMYLIIAFIVVHITGVLLAERKEGKGIVSDMINGGKPDNIT